MTEALQKLQTVTRLTPSVVRILADNPGKFTLQGTNTYLISPAHSTDSSGTVPSILIDTGEGVESYTTTLKAVLQGEDSEAGSEKRQITDVVLTHWHHDHVGGLPSVLEVLRSLGQRQPRIHKFRTKDTDGKVWDQLKDYMTKPLDDSLLPLSDGSLVSLGDTQNASTLKVVHSPGHTTDHICLMLLNEGIMFTGDHVLGQGTSVFEDLGSYLRSLQKCKNVIQQDSKQGCQLFPGHGPQIEQGEEALQQYLSHRLERERQILDLLAKSNFSASESEKGQWTIPEIVSDLYAGYPESLFPAAARGIFLHLRKLAVADEEAVERKAVPSHRADGSPNDGRRVQCLNPDGTPVDTDVLTSFSEQTGDYTRLMEMRWSLLSDDNKRNKTQL